MKKRISSWKIILVVLLLADISYSFFQYLNQPLDGDLAPIVLPWHHYETVLKDPFGISVLTEGKEYAAPNRFFIHWAMTNYFKSVPLWLQTFFDPIDSIYIASALVKIFVHLAILGLIISFISFSQPPDESKKLSKILLVAILITPLFNATEYNLYMGIINPSVTYTFFYPFPFIFLLLFFLPFFKNWNQGYQKWTFGQHLFLVFLMICLPFSGPLIAPTGLIICGLSVLYLFYSFKDGWTLTSEKIRALSYFSIFSFLCLYSVYLGTFNIENKSSSLPLLERYIQLLEGIFRQLTSKLGIPLLLFCIAINLYFFKKIKPNSVVQKLFSHYKWIAVFSLIYLLLLPLGGYRDYRPNIIRSDTFLPIMIGLIYIFGSSTFILWQQINLSERLKSLIKKLIFYRIGVGIILIIFTLGDPPNFSESDCERSALHTLSQSSEKVIQLDNDCTVMLWQKAEYPKYSRYVCQLLQEWGIMKEGQLFVQN
jgi:hypothetical protein